MLKLLLKQDRKQVGIAALILFEKILPQQSWYEIIESILESNFHLYAFMENFEKYRTLLCKFTAIFFSNNCLYIMPDNDF